MQSRRHFLKSIAAATAATPALAAGSPFNFNYTLSSAMYGEMPLETILPEVTKSGASSIDIWCRPHGNQREQITETGDAPFQALLKQHQTKLGVSTRYPLGPFGLDDEIRWMKQFGGGIIVTGSGGPKNPAGAEAKAGIKKFLESMKPHVDLAAENHVTIAIENHGNQLLFHPDSIRYFAEFNSSPNLGIALAFHHLHTWADQIPTLIRELGDTQIPFTYFQEHSEGMHKKAPKEIEMQQLPGYGGGLDYHPVVAAFRDINYTGLAEIFMHPVPRGIPVLPTAPEITAAINKSRTYIDQCLRDTA